MKVRFICEKFIMTEFLDKNVIIIGPGVRYPVSRFVDGVLINDNDFFGTDGDDTFYIQSSGWKERRQVYGGEGNDTFIDDGNDAVVIMDGGYGDDTYYFYSSNNNRRILSISGEGEETISGEKGFDTIFTTSSIFIYLGIERIVLLGSKNIDIYITNYRSRLDAPLILEGNSGNNEIRGGMVMTYFMVELVQTH